MLVVLWVEAPRGAALTRCPGTATGPARSFSGTALGVTVNSLRVGAYFRVLNKAFLSKLLNSEKGLLRHPALHLVEPRRLGLPGPKWPGPAL